MSMYNEDTEELGQHNVRAPTRAPGSQVKGVADVYEGKPGENRGIDDTMGTGVGGTLTKTGIPPGTKADTMANNNDKSPLQKVSDTISDAIDSAIGSTNTGGPSMGEKK